MNLDKIVPLGRSLEEYRKMFSLSDDDMEKTILGVGDGPASFNAEMAALGKTAVSIDPLYSFQADQIEQRYYSVIDGIIQQIRATPDNWVWSYHESPERLKENRTATLQRFIADYETGKTEGRYIATELPALDFADGKFQLALCSHFLFLYSDHITYEFHYSSILEMLRVAHEVRIFPLLTLTTETSPYVQPLIAALESEGVAVNVVEVAYEFQKGGNKMLQLRKLP